jgi:hypothetical protein
LIQLIHPVGRPEARCHPDDWADHPSKSSERADMTLIQDLTAALNALNGYYGDTPQPVSASQSAPQVDVRLDVTAVDRLSCALREICLSVPAVAGGGFDALKAWAGALSGRVTYLLENLGPLEFDPSNNEVLMRSTDADGQGGAKTYYEVLLAANADGTFSLRRYEAVKGQPRRPVDMQLTREVLGKLIGDLVATIPTPSH